MHKRRSFYTKRKKKPKLKFINGIVLQYGSIMAIEKKNQILKMFLALIPLQIDCNVLDEAYICNLNFL